MDFGRLHWPDASPLSSFIRTVKLESWNAANVQIWLQQSYGEKVSSHLVRLKIKSFEISVL